MEASWGVPFLPCPAQAAIFGVLKATVKNELPSRAIEGCTDFSSRLKNTVLRCRSHCFPRQVVAGQLVLSSPLFDLDQALLESKRTNDRLSPRHPNFARDFFPSRRLHTLPCFRVPLDLVIQGRGSKKKFEQALAFIQVTSAIASQTPDTSYSIESSIASLDKLLPPSALHHARPSPRRRAACDGLAIDNRTSTIAG